MSAIVPPAAACAEAIGDLPSGTLFPEEAVAVAQAVERRRREFAAGRLLARRALARLGRPRAAIPAGPGREPLWPTAIVGSITHCDWYCAAVVARTDVVAAIGIDAEPREPLPEGVQALIAGSMEQAWIAARRGEAACWDRLTFSAKESLFKAWFPITRHWLGFHDVRVVFDPAGGTFHAHPLVPLPCVDALERLAGRYLICDRHLLTSVALYLNG